MQGLQYGLRFACRESSLSSGSATIALCFPVFSTLFAHLHALKRQPVSQLVKRGQILLLGVAEQGETGIDPRETFSLARFKLKFRAIVLHSMFSKGP